MGNNRKQVSDGGVIVGAVALVFIVDMVVIVGVAVAIVTLIVLSSPMSVFSSLSLLSISETARGAECPPVERYDTADLEQTNACNRRLLTESG